MGMRTVPLSLEEAARAYDQGRVDGFLAVPEAALAFQWSVQARYLVDLRMNYLVGCWLLTQRAWDALSFDEQREVRAASGRADMLFDELERHDDGELLGGLFARQGLQTDAADDGFRAEFFEAARAARQRLGEDVVPAEVLQKVYGWLADYRAEHPQPSAPPSRAGH
jgi:TRAP-type C4-dicarboxylate transport system substrate-binding protein